MTGPLAELQLVAAPETVHVRVPLGATPPVPVTTAVNTKGCPTVGLLGVSEIVMVGFAWPTLTITELDVAVA